MEAVEEDPGLAVSFLEVAGLLQAGLSVEGLRDLRAVGALEPVVRLCAPAAPDGPPDWDVAAILVRPGAHVEAGALVLACIDPRRTALRLSPAGTEMRLVAEVVRGAGTVAAEPLLDHHPVHAKRSTEHAGPALAGAAWQSRYV